jgi:phospholipid/cholesterol/gamma-HCH transport system substrate-binding protein
VLGSVLVAVAIVGLILYLNRGYSGYTARVILADAGGLQTGSNVTVGGIDVGRVSNLTLTRHDRAVAELQLDHSAAPLGQGASAIVQIDGFFGEREVLLKRGDYRNHPERSGATIPVQNSAVSVRLDDVVDTLNPDVQGALRTFLNEQGRALVGRGGSLAATLSELPHSLPALTQLLGQLSANQQALGDLVDRSDRVVAQVAGQRAHLGDMINSAHGTLAALASRRTDLGATVRTAPATLAQARSTLATLQGTAIPLAPAADGLRATAPALTAALHEIPTFANAAVPTLREVSRVAPKLQQLADVGTPVVRSLAPLTSRLESYTSQALAPLTTMLADRGGAANLFGEMEGWARSTQGYDASSHIFRFGATLSAASFKQLLSMLSVPGLPPLKNHRASHASTPAAPVPPAPSAPAAAQHPLPSLGGIAGALGGALGGAVHGTLGAVQGTAGAVAAGAAKTLAGATGLASGAGSHLNALLGYLLRK